MKKIIALLVITVGISFSANAQKKTPAKAAVKKEAASTESAFEKAAANDLAALQKAVTISADEKVSLKGLFEYKHRELSTATNDAARNVIYKTIDAKLRATLTADQTAALDKNPELLKTLTH